MRGSVSTKLRDDGLRTLYLSSTTVT